MRRVRWTALGAGRWTIVRARLTGLAVRLIDLTLLTVVALATGFSATWTAPPTSRAVPAAVADSFARAILTDMGATFVSLRGAHRRIRSNMPLSLQETAVTLYGQLN